MNLRLSLRYFLSVLVSFCIVFSSSFCGIAKADSITPQAMFFSNDLLRSTSSDFDIVVDIGSYDMRTNSFLWTNSKSYTSSDGVSTTGGFGTTIDYNTYTGIALRLNFSNFEELLNFRIMLGRLNISLFDGADTSFNRYYMYTDKYRVMSSFCDYDFEGSLRNGTTHFVSYASSTEYITPNVLTAYPGYYNNPYQLLLDINGNPTIPDVSLWENYYESSNGNSVSNVTVENLSCTFVFYINDAFVKNSDGSLFLDNVEVGDTCYLYFYLGNNVATINGDSYGDTTGISSLASTISTSISSMGSSLSNQITQVKTQLTNSTNTITTKIDTMSQNIQNGLQNVITSAQQNTQNIINTVTTKVDQVKTGITEVKDSILDLPNKISEMLIGLVVPDEETMIAQKEQWEQLLSDRFGVVYESVAMVDSVVGAFTDNGTTSTITMPTVTVPVAGEDFVFGGYEVDVVPQGFSVLVEALKLIIDIVVTLAFINAMKNRYEQLVSR